MIELSNGFMATSHYRLRRGLILHPALHSTSPDDHRVVIFDSISPRGGLFIDVPMKEAVSDLREAFGDPEVARNPAAEHFVRGLGSYQLRSTLREWRTLGGVSSSYRLEPSREVALAASQHMPEEAMPVSAEVLGVELNGADLIRFCAHVMGYSAVCYEPDPRVTWTQEVRAQQAATA